MIPSSIKTQFDHLLEQLYNAKCEDLKLKINLEQQKRFIEANRQHITGRKICLNDIGFGPQAVNVLIKIFKKCPYVSYLELRNNNL